MWYFFCDDKQSTTFKTVSLNLRLKKSSIDMDLLQRMHVILHSKYVCLLVHNSRLDWNICLQLHTNSVHKYVNRIRKKRTQSEDSYTKSFSHLQRKKNPFKLKAESRVSIGISISISISYKYCMTLVVNGKIHTHAVGA